MGPKAASVKAAPFSEEQMLFLARLYHDYYHILGSTTTTTEGNRLRNEKYEEVGNLYNGNPDWLIRTTAQLKVKLRNMMTLVGNYQCYDGRPRIM